MNGQPETPFSAVLSAVPFQTPGGTLRHGTLDLNRTSDLLSVATLDVTVRWPAAPYPQLAGQHIHPSWLLLQPPEMQEIPDALAGEALETAMNAAGYGDDAGEFGDSDSRKRRILQLSRNFQQVQFSSDSRPGSCWEDLCELIDLPPAQAHQQLWLRAGSSPDPLWAIRRLRYCWGQSD